MLSLLAGELCHVSTERLAIRIDVSTRNAEPAAMRNWRMMGKHLAWSDRDCSGQSQAESGRRGCRAGRKRVFPCWSTRVTLESVPRGTIFPKNGGIPPRRTGSGGNQKCFHVEHLGSTSSSLFHVKQLASRGS